MAWFFLILAIVIVLLAVTNRLEHIDRSIVRFISKLRTAWEYAREDWEDTEAEIREEARRRSGEAEREDVGTSEEDSDLGAQKGR